MAEQLTFDLPHRAALGGQDFLVAPANADAVAWIDRWPDWPAHGLAICGAAGSGKTHLTHVWAEHLRARGASARQLAASDLDRLGDLPPGPAILDPADGGLSETGLFHLLNWVRENGQFLLLTGALPPSHWPVALPDLRSRLLALPVAQLAAPDDQLLSAVLVKLFDDRQLRVGADLVAWLVPRIERSFAAAQDAVQRLDRAALAAQRSLTIPLARRALGPGEATKLS